MLPLLKQCYDSAISARSLASAIKSGEVGSLRLALSQTIDPSLVMPHVVELGKLFNGLELKLYRGNGAEVLGYLKRGDAELGLARRSRRGMGAPRLLGRCSPRISSSWSTAMHRLANAGAVALDDLKQERFVVRTYCESTPTRARSSARRSDFDVERRHETGAESDLIALLEAGVGVALVPRSTRAPDTLMRIMVDELELSRTVYLYGVAGRQRTAVASALMKMLRACDWSRYAAARGSCATMTPKPVTIAVDETRRVSGLLQRPRGARACYVLAHGAGAGMTHPFMAAVADGLAERGIATLALSVPLHGAGRQAARSAEARARHGARRGGGGGTARAEACRSSPAANRSAAA